MHAALSHYVPNRGGVNCGNFVRGKCISRMASGLAWQDWIGRAAACPMEFPFWTKIILPGGELFYCLDHGGAIVTRSDNVIWIDLLVDTPPVPFGTVVDVRVIQP